VAGYCGETFFRIQNWSKHEKSLDQKKSNVEHVVKRRQRGCGIGSRPCECAGETPGRVHDEKRIATNDGSMGGRADRSDYSINASEKKEEALAGNLKGRPRLDATALDRALPIRKKKGEFSRQSMTKNKNNEVLRSTIFHSVYYFSSCARAPCRQCACSELPPIFCNLLLTARH
jgi:hypothetical protein